MTKIFIYSLLFINLGYSQNLMPYVSPGIQIGINNNKKFNFSYQISIGLASTEDPFFSTGIICAASRNKFIPHTAHSF